ncbi:Hypothetical Protein FCC1311_089682 [Hondaea fermentalgiana]|uniref:Uncharacterized protein n=1 Tax=Hondaea fermentalgiana TaxID=2315210 RepID=A0A2R5GVQ3_9STRA|nr:Hypothetical Protein FCC1311_089682 [Hondaea fermentalgiana]|eukprot:GBG32743.1 Hypothetical Protein FCC1311_089682 [Hondaea fermentalgiana]
MALSISIYGLVLRRPPITLAILWRFSVMKISTVALEKLIRFANPQLQIRNSKSATPNPQLQIRFKPHPRKE